jgi:predicted nucleic acid-binding protein
VSPVVCADSGVALKLVFAEADSPLAEVLWRAWDAEQTTVIAPSLWAYEVTSVVRKRVYRGLSPADLEEETFEALHRLPVQLSRPAGLHRRARELAQHFGRPATYDSHYLALAEMAGCEFWTADERLFNAVRDQLGWVRWLGSYRPAGGTGS